MVVVSRNSGGVKADCTVVELGSRDSAGVELRHNSGCVEADGVELVVSRQIA